MNVSTHNPRTPSRRLVSTRRNRDERNHRRLVPLAALGLVGMLAACGQSVGSAPADTLGADADDSGTTTTATAAPTGVGESQAGPVSVESCGTELTVQAPAQRLVGMSPGSTELLLRLGVGDRLVGQAQVDIGDLPDDVAGEVADVPALSEDVPPAREDLLATEPDLVVTQTTYELTAEQGFASQEQLQEAGAGAYVATAGCFDRRAEGTVTDLFTDIENLGLLLGVPDEAATLVAEYEEELAEIEAATSGQEPLTVAQVFVAGSDLSVIGAGIERDIIDRAGGENVFQPDEPQFADFFAAQVNPEVVAERNPDAFVFAAATEDDEQAVRDYLQRTFPNSTAVQEDRMIAINTNDTLPGAPGNVRAVRTIAEGLYPDAF